MPIARDGARDGSQQGHTSANAGPGMTENKEKVVAPTRRPQPVSPAPVACGLSGPFNIDSRRFGYDARLRRVKHYVEKRFNEPLPLGRVAQVAGLEKSYFSRYFHKKTGVCYHDWLHCVRVSHAIELMNSQELSVTEIAFAVGYQDLRTFERAFNKFTGLCPKAMKKRLLSDLYD